MSLSRIRLGADETDYFPQIGRVGDVASLSVSLSHSLFLCVCVSLSSVSKPIRWTTLRGQVGLGWTDEQEHGEEVAIGAIAIRNNVSFVPANIVSKKEKKKEMKIEL